MPTKLVNFDITVLVYSTVIVAINLSNPTDCIFCSVSLKLICIQKWHDSRFRCSSFLAKVNNIIQDLGYSENGDVSGAMLTIIKHELDIS